MKLRFPENSLELLKAAYLAGGKWHDKFCENAAELGCFDQMKFAHENGAPWGKDTCTFIVEYGNLEMLKYAHTNGAPWDEMTCITAAMDGELECLKYAYENGCPLDVEMCLEDTESEECIAYILKCTTCMVQYDTSLDTTSNDSDDECEICFENKRKVQFKPCNHCMCIRCNNEIIERRMANICQFCRQYVNENCLI